MGGGKRLRGRHFPSCVWLGRAKYVCGGANIETCPLRSALQVVLVLFAAACFLCLACFLLPSRCLHSYYRTPFSRVKQNTTSDFVVRVVRPRHPQTHEEERVLTPA